MHLFCLFVLTASKVVRGPMASTTGAQERIDQPEKPVTLQFRGKTFTLSYSQFCLLVGRQSLKQQGVTLCSTLLFFKQ